MSPTIFWPGAAAVKSRATRSGMSCADAGRAGLPGQGGDGRIPEGYEQVSVTDLLLVIVFVLVIAGLTVVVVAGGGCGRGRDVAAQAVADGDVAELGERGEGGVPADPVPGA